MEARIPPILRRTEEPRTEDVLTRLPGVKASEAGHLTPANWLRARQGKAAPKAA